MKVPMVAPKCSCKISILITWSKIIHGMNDSSLDS
jgi:hypothetical protein